MGTSMCPTDLCLYYSSDHIQDQWCEDTFDERSNVPDVNIFDIKSLNINTNLADNLNLLYVY